MKVNSIIPRITQVKNYQQQSPQKKANSIAFKKKFIENPEVIFGGAIAVLFNPLIGLGILLTAILMDTINNNNNNKKNKNSNTSDKFKFLRNNYDSANKFYKVS